MSDVIIVGAGFSGVACALILAEKGHQVLLLEADAPETLGQRSARMMLDVDTFSKSGLSRPPAEEWLSLLDVFYAYSPSGDVRKAVDFSSILLKGTPFLQRLLREAMAAGAIFEQAEVTAPLVVDGQLKGVCLSNGSEREARMVIDASGHRQVLAQALVEQGLLPILTSRHLGRTHGIAYRKTCRTDANSSELHIHFCLPGGYIWRSAYDIGLGMMSDSVLDVAEMRAEVERVATQLNWQIEAAEREDWGQIPVRYPLLSLVGNNFAILGDAAYMVNAVRGGGISAGLKGARILAECLHVALGEGDLSYKYLWSYNVQYQRQWGAALAYQDVMRQILMQEPLDLMEFAFAKDIITSDDIKGSLAGRLLDFSPLQKLQKGLRGAAHPALLLRFNQRLEWGKALYERFRQYPETPVSFEVWESETLSLLEQIAR